MEFHKNKIQIAQFLNLNNIILCDIRPDLSVDVNTSTYIMDLDYNDQLCVNFNVVQGYFTFRGGLGLGSLWGSPREVTGDFGFANNEVTSFAGAPKSCKSVMAYGNNIDSLEGIAEVFDSVRGSFCMDFDGVKRGGIGLLHIKNLKKISSGRSNTPLPKPFEIISKYIGRPEDIFECQAELIDNGLEQFAEF